MVDVRTLVDQATQSMARAAEPIARSAADTAEAGASLAAQGIQASEAIADALTSAIRALPGKLRDIEVPRVKQKLEEVAGQLTAIAARCRKLAQHLRQASLRIGDTGLQDGGKLIVEAFDALASVVGFLKPGQDGLFRWVPVVVARPYLDAVMRAETALRAAGDLARTCVRALPDVSEGFNDVAEDLERAADLLDGTSKTIRELSGLFPI